jgi:hypothetical protein
MPIMATLKVPVTQHDHIRGPANAPITPVEYGDYECPHCALAHPHPIVNQAQLSFSVRLSFVFRHFPLAEVIRTPRSPRKAPSEAVHVHEIELAKTPEDLPLQSLRADPWLGDERLGQP